MESKRLLKMKHRYLAIGLFLFSLVGFIYWKETTSNKPAITYNHYSGAQETTLIFPKGKIQGNLNCIEKTSVFFLKIHKCGSSTVQNIFMRFGRSRHLNFVLPEKDNYVGNPESFSPDMIGPKLALDEGEKYDIFTHHTRFEYSAIKGVMKEKAPFVTIMRDPIALQLSMYDYYRFNRLYNTSLANLLHVDYNTLSQLPRVWQKLGWNQMAWDLGVSIQEIHSPKIIPSLISKIEVEFDLVMITEFMEASLVLLAELMCWPLEEVRFLSLNNRKNAHEESILTEKERYMLQELNIIDVNIYNHFKKRFKDRVQNYGVDRMFSQVKRLVELNSKLFFECVQGLTTENAIFDVIQYVLKPNAPTICAEVVCDELVFTHELRNDQTARIKAINHLKNFLQK